jgi:Middle or third domain of peptidase_M16
MDVKAADISRKHLFSPDFEGTLDDKKVKYRVVALASEGAGALRRFGDESDFDAEDIAFPPIPPAPLPTHLPKLVSNTQVLKLWHLQDRTFKRPIADFRVLLHCAEANKTPLYGACADLLVHLVSDALTETAYLASVCELGSSLAAFDGGFSMRVHGFHDKLLDLFAAMFDLLMKFHGRDDGSLPDSISKGRFDLCLESYIRHCTNSGMKASKLASNLRIQCLRPNSWSSHEKVSLLVRIPPTLVSLKSLTVILCIVNLAKGNQRYHYSNLC